MTGTEQEPDERYTQTWHGCYDDGWKGRIVDDAFTHPAKMAYDLLDRILRYMALRGWIGKGDVIGDPFGGIGSTGILGSAQGYRVVMVELEERFVELARRNFGLYRHYREKLGDITPVIIHGDSREFAKLVGECAAVVCSPPYAETAVANTVGGGQVDPKLIDESLRRKARGEKGVDLGRTQQREDTKQYGQAPGQIGAMKAGKLDAVVTSPPWENQEPSHCSSDKPYNKKLAAAGVFTGRVVDSEYGQADGQIGNTTSDTYWAAVRDVYAQVMLALKPGGVFVLVVKDYIKAGKRVPLCDDTLTLLMSLGFDPVERIRAMLVKETRTDGLFGEIVETKERKSFFRRLAERKGCPRLDWEEVLIVRKADT